MRRFKKWINETDLHALQAFPDGFVKIIHMYAYYKIYKRNQESKKTRTHAFDQERKKENTLSTMKKKERKHDFDQEKKKKKKRKITCSRQRK